MKDEEKGDHDEGFHGFTDITAATININKLLMGNMPVINIVINWIFSQYSTPCSELFLKFNF